MGYVILLLFFAVFRVDCAHREPVRALGQYYQMNGVWYCQVSDKFRVKVNKENVPDKYKNTNQKEQGMSR